MAPARKILLLLGGHYHDFAGFEAAVRQVLEPECEIEATYDPERLGSLKDVGTVMLYTCHVEPPRHENEGLRYVEGIPDRETAALVEWVRSGGGLAAVHSATTIRESNRKLIRLVGGRFLSHPPRLSFTVYPLSRPHPVTDGVGAFSIVDELYTQEVGEVDVHMAAVSDDVMHPMVWTRTEGDGRVVHLAPGHDREVWHHPSYQRLLRQSIAWVHPV